jgi:hypothetical protein
MFRPEIATRFGLYKMDSRMLANPWTAQFLKKAFDNPGMEGQWYVIQAVHAADALIAELNNPKP